MEELTNNEKKNLILIIRFLKRDLENEIYKEKIKTDEFDKAINQIIEKCNYIIDLNYKTNEDSKKLQSFFVEYQTLMENNKFTFSPKYINKFLNCYLNNVDPFE